MRNRSNIESAKQIREALKKANEASARLRRAIQELIHRVETGKPLLGRCPRCPRVFEKEGKIHIPP
jgi:hypothetical protein